MIWPRYIFLIVIMITAIEDYKSKTVPDKLVIINFLLGGITMFIYSGFKSGYLVHAGISCVVIFIILIALNYFTKGQIGMGDVKFITSMGVYFGIYEILGITFYGTLSAAIVGGILIGMKKANKKTNLPFIPFLLTGTIIYMVINI